MPLLPCHENPDASKLSSPGMSLDVNREAQLEIGHVLFLDVVGYSKLSVDDQHDLLAALNTIVRSSKSFLEAEQSGKLIRVPTGDGMALVFFSTPEAPIRCAIEFARSLKENSSIEVRMGIHSGPVSIVSDVNDRSNVAGAGINIAQRVMDCGEAGHILLSKHVAEDLEHYRYWQPYLHDLGTVEVKHGLRLGLVNFYSDDIGNPALPRKLQIPAQPSATSIKRKQSLTALSAACVLILAGAIIYKILPPRTQGLAAAGPGLHSLAVLPLKNLSGDPGQDYFADGVTDSLITDLAHIHSLRVLSFQSVQRYKGDRTKNLPQIGRELNVDGLIEGSVQKQGDTVLINAQLVEAPTDRHIWAERYTRKARDMLDAQNEIVGAITEAVKAELTPTEKTRLTKARPIDPEAQSHYFLGRFYFSKGTEDGFREAIHHFEQAIAKEPNFASAYAGIADCYSTLSSQYIPPRQAMPEAENAARKALEIDPELAEAHAALGYINLFYHWDRSEGERELVKALELRPSYSTAYLNYGLLLISEARFDEALAQLAKAQELEPTSAVISWQIEWALFLAGKYQETIAQCQHTLSLEPKMAGSYDDMGLAYLYLGDKDKALAMLKKAVEMDYMSATVTNYAYALAATGNKAEAERVLDGFLERSKGKYVCAYEVATAYEGMNERGKALEWLQRGYDEKCDCLVWGMTEPWMGEFRRDPRYKAILAKAGLL
jgi:TolB-like protein/class 3 adenylate cyclase/Flp pilus assembly protein TadD